MTIHPPDSQAPAGQPQTTSVIANLKKAIALQESLRPSLGDEIVNTTLQVLRAELALLEKPAAPPPQRKQLTVLFASLQDFSALSEDVDVEDLHHLVSAVWERLDHIILAYGGQINKHMGDSVIALWGGGVSREDDPQRALSASLAMRQELSGLGASLPFPGLLASLHIRIGLHTGPVLLSAPGAAQEYTVLGDTVTIANRIQNTAIPNQILISHSTYRHVHGVFDCQEIAPIQVQGSAQPQRTYQVNGFLPRAFHVLRRVVEGIETRMVGRQEHLLHLQAAFQQVSDQRQAQLITILADPGLGKSRLLYEFLQWLAGQAQHNRIKVYQGRAAEEIQSIPCALLREVISTAFNLSGANSLVAEVPDLSTQQKLEAGLAEFREDRPSGGLEPAASIETRARFISHLLGFSLAEASADADILSQSSPRQAYNRAMEYMLEYFQAAAQQQPVVFILDDIHWADDSTLEILLNLGQLLINQPLLIVCAARPALYERRPLWDEALPFSHRLELPPLTPQDSLDLADDILQRLDDPSPALRQVLVKNADGNPFFIEELVKMLIDERVIQVGPPGLDSLDENTWSLDPSRLTGMHLPTTITGILQARFDSLPAEERLVLQWASIVGRTFWDGALAYLSEQTTRGDQPTAAEPAVQPIRDTLDSLCRREIIFRQPVSRFENAQEYTFKHTLMRDAVYYTILKRLRRSYHALVADWLIQHHSSGDSAITGLIAEHLEQAERVKQALLYLRKAGEQAAAQYANLEAIGYLTRAIHLTPQADTTTRLELLLLRESIYALQADRLAQEKDLVEMQYLADILKDDCRTAEVLLRRARHAQQTSNYATAITWARQAARLAQSCSSSQIRAAAHLEQGRALYRKADYAEAATQLEQALLLAADQPPVAAEILQTLVTVHLHQGKQVASQRYLEQALQLVRQSGDRQTEGNVLVSVGATLNDRGSYAQAQHYLNQALAVFREIGDRHGQAVALQQLGLATDKQHHYDRARQFYLQALAIYHTSDDRMGVAWMSDAIGSLLQYQGQPMQASPYFEKAIDIYRSIGVPWGEAISLHNLGFAQMTVGQFDAARQYFQQALAVCQAAGDRWGTIWRLSYLGLMAHQQNDNHTAINLTSEALLIAREFGARHEQGMVLTHHAHALAALGQGPQAQAAYEQALVLRRQLGESNLAWETMAGLARLSLAHDDIEQALADIEHILAALAEPDALDGTDEPARIYLTCCQILQAAGDPRTAQLKATAQAWLAARLESISDPAIQQSFLQNIPAHRALQEL